MVRLPGYDDRKPGELSGGQRQRVALARAIVNRPRVLLLDEPLGALDLKLREQMQVELKQIQGEVGITFVYVTHDQDEALTMSDRIAVFNEGRIEQVGPPVELYEQPATEFVAGFVGVSNLLERDGARFTIRPEKIQLVDPAAARQRPAHRARPHRRDVAYAGMVTRYTVALDAGGELQVVRQNLEGTSADAPPSRAGRSLWAGARSTRSPSEGVRHRGGITVRTHDAHPARHGWLIGAGLRRLRASARRLRIEHDNSSSTGKELQKVGKGEGAAQPDRLGRLRRAGMDEADFEQKTGCKVNDKDRRHLRRDGRADADRPVRRRLGVGQRHRPPGRRRRRRPGQRRPRPELQDGLQRPQEPAVQHRRRRQLRHPARPRREPADVEQRTTSSRRRTPGT